jgi:hypothetical protein
MADELIKGFLFAALQKDLAMLFGRAFLFSYNRTTSGSPI